MIYTINGTVKFKPEDGTLWNTDDPGNVINLTITNSNLLRFILDSEGVILFREKILEELWERQGLSPSNNTLNQYISISRRAISLLGVEDDVIITVPRTGFRLNNTITLVKTFENQENYHSLSRVGIKKTTSRKCWVTIFIVALLALITGVYYYLCHSKNNSINNLPYAGEYHSCDVYVINAELTGKKDTILTSVKTLMDKASAECTPGKTFIAGPDFRGRGRAFLAECTRNEESNKYSLCKGYYIK